MPKLNKKWNSLDSVKGNKSLTIFNKTLEIIKSCDTEEQLKIAQNYLSRASLFLHAGTTAILRNYLNSRYCIIKGLYTQGTTIHRS